jgi:hypothetical protein
MKVVKNAISDELIGSLNKQIDLISSGENWKFSNNSWNPDNPPPYMAFGKSKVGNTTKIKILDELGKHLPEDKQEEIFLNYHYMLPHSGLQWHGDKGYSFGATLFLNTFKKQWGGLFLWENDEGEIRAEIPEAGKLVIVEGEKHCVTPLMYKAPPRRTIQIWGLEEVKEYHDYIQ